MVGYNDQERLRELLGLLRFVVRRLFLLSTLRERLRLSLPFLAAGELERETERLRFWCLR
jgi:hypothetical protein